MDRDGELLTLNTRIKACTSCEMSCSRTNVVPGEGDSNAVLMFIGEGPGEEEDLSGRPFVGRSGELLNKAIISSGISREQVFITNVVKCRPPGNRNPTNNEMERCHTFLGHQSVIICPKVIVTLGKIASEFILQRPVKIKKENGHLDFIAEDMICVMTVLHPAYVLRNQKPEVREGFFQAIQDARNIAYGIPRTSDDRLLKTGVR